MHLLDPSLSHIILNLSDNAPEDGLIFVQLDQLLVTGIEQRDLGDLVLFFQVEDCCGELCEFGVLF